MIVIVTYGHTGNKYVYSHFSQQKVNQFITAVGDLYHGNVRIEVTDETQDQVAPSSEHSTN